MESYFLIYGVIFGAITLFGFYSYTKYKKVTNAAAAKADEFLLNNPGAAEVLISQVHHKLSGGGITINNVDGQDAIFKMEGTKFRIYLTPGKHIIELSFSYMKKSMLSKNRTFITIGPVKAEVEAETGKKYSLEYDKIDEKFKFEEM